MKELINEVTDYYSRKFAEFGETPRGVDWNGEESQKLRFDQLTRVIKPAISYTLNDLGCGYGALYEYLCERPKSFYYHGIDLAAEMIKAAQSRYEQASNANFYVSEKPRNIVDYGVASGIFNVKQDRSNEEWRNYIIETLKNLNNTSNKGFSFNCLTVYSDRKKMLNYLYYADPLWLFDFCKRQFSKDVALLHDYGLFEFTILVRKHNRLDAKNNNI